MTETPSFLSATTSAAEPLDQTSCPDQTSPHSRSMYPGKGNTCGLPTCHITSASAQDSAGSRRSTGRYCLSLDMVSHRDRLEAVVLSSPCLLHQRSPQAWGSRPTPVCKQARSNEQALVGCSYLCPPPPNIHKAEEVQEARTISTRSWDSCPQETRGCYLHGEGHSSIRKSWPAGGKGC